jgi:hypothetical protein
MTSFSRFKLGVCLLGVFGPFTLTPCLANTDDAPAINAAIASAIQAGVGMVELGPRTYQLRTPVVIPPGTRNFTLRGAGSNQTVFRTVEAMPAAIRIGASVFTHNNWGIANRPSVSVQPVGEGAAFLRVDAPVTPGFYVLWDEYRVVNMFGDASSMNRAELVRVIAYRPAQGLVQLERPVGREYTVRPKLSDVQQPLSHNVEVSGIGLDGLSLGGTISQNLVQGYLTKGLTLRDVRGTNFLFSAISVVQCEDALIDQCHIADASAGAPGQGYGFNIVRSRFVRIENSSASRMRHGYVMHSGTMDVVVRDSMANRADYDLHGFDERRITFSRCGGDVGMNVGNAAWLGGARTVLVEDCDLPGVLWVGPNVTHLRVQRSRIGSSETAHSVTVHAQAFGTKGTPAGGRPGQILFDDCDIRGFNSLLRYSGAAMGTERITFARTRFLQTKPDWGTLLRLDNGAGRLAFDRCDFTMTSTYPPIVAHGLIEGLHLSFADSRIFSPGSGAAMGIWLQSQFHGTLAVARNTFFTQRPNATFVRNDSPSQVLVTGPNTVSAPQ